MFSYIQTNKLILILFSLLVIFLVRVFKTHLHKKKFLNFLGISFKYSILSVLCPFFYFLFQKLHHIIVFILFLSWKAFLSHPLQKFRDFDVFRLFLLLYSGKNFVFLIKRNNQFLFS